MSDEMQGDRERNLQHTSDDHTTQFEFLSIDSASKVKQLNEAADALLAADRRANGDQLDRPYLNRQQLRERHLREYCWEPRVMESQFTEPLP